MIFIRADANKNIGMGHVMRTLSLADEMKSFAPVMYVVADESVAGLIRERGFDVFVLHTDYTDMEDELEKWPEVKGEDTIIVDSYFVTAAYLFSLKRKGKVVYIDDVLSFPYPADVIVNYNAYADSSAYHKLYEGCGSAEPELILGPAYAPLRAMFQNVPHREQPEVVRNVLISTGGSDELHVAITPMAVMKRVEDITGTRHCLKVVDCATDKTRDIRAREAVAWNKERYCWLGERPGWRSCAIVAAELG